MNWLMNDEAVYRTAPATPGLLIIGKNVSLYLDVLQENSTKLSSYFELVFGPLYFQKVLREGFN